MRQTPRDFRRALRQTATPAERRLWSILRDRRLSGFKFRRQHPVGPYVLDFYCAAARLGLELDGSVHEDPARSAYDTERQQVLEERHEIHVLRFSNEDVLTNPEAVVVGILAAAGRRGPSPCPSPRWGEGTT